MKYIFLIFLIFGFVGMHAQRSGKSTGAWEFQKKLNREFKNADRSPLTVKDRAKLKK